MPFIVALIFAVAAHEPDVFLFKFIFGVSFFREQVREIINVEISKRGVTYLTGMWAFIPYFIECHKLSACFREFFLYSGAGFFGFDGRLMIRFAVTGTKHYFGTNNTVMIASTIVPYPHSIGYAQVFFLLLKQGTIIIKKYSIVTIPNMSQILIYFLLNKHIRL